jgi:hypothetical protein
MRKILYSKVCSNVIKEYFAQNYWVKFSNFFATMNSMIESITGLELLGRIEIDGVNI